MDLPETVIRVAKSGTLESLGRLACCSRSAHSVLSRVLAAGKLSRLLPYDVVADYFDGDPQHVTIAFIIERLSQYLPLLGKHQRKPQLQRTVLALVEVARGSTTPDFIISTCADAGKLVTPGCEWTPDNTMRLNILLTTTAVSVCILATSAVTQIVPPPTIFMLKYAFGPYSNEHIANQLVKMYPEGELEILCLTYFDLMMEWGGDVPDWVLELSSSYIWFTSDSLLESMEYDTRVIEKYIEYDVVPASDINLECAELYREGSLYDSLMQWWQSQTWATPIDALSEE